MRIPFDIKFRPQIESGEYKVETEDGYPARIICWDSPINKERPIIAIVFNDQIEQYKANGRYDNDYETTNYDLFIVTPEEELTEFEKKLWEVLKSEGSPIGPIEKFTDDDKRVFHAYAAKLLALAIDTRANELFGGLIQSELDKDSIHYNLIEFMCNLYDCQNWKEIEETAEAYVTRIKAAAMKDLPRWKKCDLNTFYNTKCNFVVNGIGRYLILDGYMIDVDRLEKLPGFKEDESHE